MSVQTALLLDERVIPALPSEQRDEKVVLFAEEVANKLGDSRLVNLVRPKVHTLTGSLAKLEVGIIPTGVVREYQRQVVREKNARFKRYWFAFGTGLILPLVGVYLNLFHLFPVLIVDSTWAVLSGWLLARMMKRNSWKWFAVRLEKYEFYVPNEALALACRIKDELPSAIFEVEYLNFEKNDPFLRVYLKEDETWRNYYLYVWEEDPQFVERVL